MNGLIGLSYTAHQMGIPQIIGSIIYHMHKKIILPHIVWLYSTTYLQ
jgi:hypothetical protein